MAEPGAELRFQKPEPSGALHMLFIADWTSAAPCRYLLRLRCVLAVLLLCPGFGVEAAVHIDVTTTADEYGTGAACSFREALRSLGSGVAFGGCVFGSGF